jgi:type VI secretion system protein VasD
VTFRRTILLLPVLMSSRCAPAPPPPATLDLAIACGPGINPDDAGKPAPVAVRLFFLNAPTRFQRADVFPLTEQEKATLAEEGAGSEEMIVRPGQHLAVTRDVPKGVRFLGVAVLFRDIDRAKWRAVAPLASSGPNRLTLTVEGTEAKLAPT